MAFRGLLSAQSANLRSTITTRLQTVGDNSRTTSASILSHATASRVTCLWCENDYKCRKECKRHAAGHFINYFCPVSGCGHTATRRDHFTAHLNTQHLISDQNSPALRQPRNSIIDSASFAVNNWKALGCGICGKPFKLEDRRHIAESNVARIGRLQKEYVNHCLAHLKHGKKTREDWSDTQRILGLLQQHHIHAKWTELLHERDIDHQTYSWRWEGGRTAEFIAMLQRGDMYPGDTYHDDALSLVTLLEAGQPRSTVDAATLQLQNTTRGVFPAIQPEMALAAPMVHSSGAQAGPSIRGNITSLDLSRITFGTSSPAYERMNGKTLIGSRSISPVATATRFDAGIIHPLTPGDRMYVSDDGFSPEFGSPDLEAKFEDASPLPALSYGPSPAHGDRPGEIVPSDPAHYDQSVGHGVASYPHQTLPRTQLVLAHHRQGLAAGKTTHLLHPSPASDSGHNRKKRPVSFTKQIKRASREITSAIFATRRTVNNVHPEFPQFNSSVSC